MEKNSKFDKHILKVMMRLEDSMNSRKLKSMSETDDISFEREEQSDSDASETEIDN